MALSSCSSFDVLSRNPLGSSCSQRIRTGYLSSKVWKTLTCSLEDGRPAIVHLDTKSEVFFRPSSKGRSTSVLRIHSSSSSSGAPAAVEQSAAQEFVDWLKGFGLPEQAVEIKLEENKSNGQLPATASGFFCVAGRDIKEGEILLQVPENFTVTSLDVASHPAAGAAAKDKGELIGLALWLMCERAKGKDSLWWRYLQLLPETTGSPLLWPKDECEQLLKGSPVLDELRARRNALEAEYEKLKQTHFSNNPEVFPLDMFTLDAFLRSVSVALLCSVYLPSADIIALVPFVEMVPQSMSSSAQVDYDADSQSVVLKADKNYSAGERVVRSYGGELPNAELFIRQGHVEDSNPNNFLEIEVSLIPTDPLYAIKQQLLQEVGFAAAQKFPLYIDRFPMQLLSFSRLARVQDSALLMKATFERDDIINEITEYEALMLLMADCRDRLAEYSGGVDDDERLLKMAKGREREAVKLRLAEKRILSSTISVLRMRLAPIRGIPAKGGAMKDPNLEIKEMFETMEKSLSAPRRLLSGFFGKRK